MVRNDSTKKGRKKFLPSSRDGCSARLTMVGGTPDERRRRFSISCVTQSSRLSSVASSSWICTTSSSDSRFTSVAFKMSALLKTSRIPPSKTRLFCLWVHEWKAIKKSVMPTVNPPWPNRDSPQWTPSELLRSLEPAALWPFQSVDPVENPLTKS